MRKSMLRSLLVLGGAFALLAAFTPRANADCPGCLRFYDMERPAGTFGVGQGSHPPATQQGEGFGIGLFGFAFQNDDGTAYTNTNLSAVTGQEPGGVGDTNFPSGANPNDLSLKVVSSGQAHLNIVMDFTSATGIYDINSVSFAHEGSGNGFQQVTLQASTNGGATWVNLSAIHDLPTGLTTIVLTNTNFSTVGFPNLLIRLHFENGQSNGNNTQNLIDNIQVNGTAVPEPATVAGGLLGVLGLCWHQRRRLRSFLPLSRRA
jgi:hypothetical protein